MPPVDQHGLSEDSLRGSEQFALPREETPAPVPTGKFEPTSEQELAAVRRAGLRQDGRPTLDFPTPEPPTQTAPNSGALGIADWQPDQIADTNPGGDRETEPTFDVDNPDESRDTSGALTPEEEKVLEDFRRTQRPTFKATDATHSLRDPNVETQPSTVRTPGTTLPVANPNTPRPSDATRPTTVSGPYNDV